MLLKKSSVYILIGSPEEHFCQKKRIVTEDSHLCSDHNKIETEETKDIQIMAPHCLKCVFLWFWAIESNICGSSNTRNEPNKTLICDVVS